jgi:hypothetical protein
VFGCDHADGESDRRSTGDIGQARYHATFKRTGWTPQIVPNVHFNGHRPETIIESTPVQTQGLLKWSAQIWVALRHRSPTFT